MDRFAVKVSATLLPLLQEWKRINKEQPTRAESLLYRAIVAGIDGIIANPDHATDRKHALSGDLAGVYRLKMGPKSRYRVFYLSSPERKLSIVLWVGYRKEGDKNDAYTDFGRRLANGDFEADFKAAGFA